jgi:hypothetical protein
MMGIDRLELWAAACALTLACACGGEDEERSSSSSGGLAGGLQSPGFVLDAASSVDFAPELVQAKFYKNMNSASPSDDYAFLMSQSENAAFVASLRFDNDSVPAEGVVFDVGGGNYNPSVGTYFFSVDGNLLVLGGTLRYAAAGANEGELVSLVFDLELEGGKRLAAEAAANLVIEIIEEQPPS